MEAARSGSALPMTKGEQTREFTYVTDVAEAFAVAATHPAAVGEVFNVDRGEDYALRDVVGLVARVTGLPVRAGFGAIPYRPGETMRFVGDPSKARERLGWKARIGLEEGVRRTWEWYRGERAEAEA
jgi:nucleoside-diphosphate-sugar epimerase